MKRKLQYSNKDRGGYVMYEDEFSCFSMFFEYGGGNCVAIIWVPTEKEWHKKLNRPLEERKEILEFVAEQAIKDQVKNGYYRISENTIEIFQD